MILEVCVENVESALIAEANGCARIELCSSLSEGGVTPSYGLIRTCKDSIKIPIHVLIRPR
jgi:copper homeostasis protein